MALPDIDMAYNICFPALVTEMPNLVLQIILG